MFLNSIIQYGDLGAAAYLAAEWTAQQLAAGAYVLYQLGGEALHQFWRSAF